MPPKMSSNSTEGESPCDDPIQSFAALQISLLKRTAPNFPNKKTAMTNDVLTQPNCPVRQPFNNPTEITHLDVSPSRGIPSSPSSSNQTSSQQQEIQPLQPLESPASFKTLSSDIHLAIWELARPEPRIVRPKWAKREKVAISNAPIPNMLHICRESREVALKWYRLAFATNPSYKLRNTGRIYFDFSRDWYLAGCEEKSCNGIRCQRCQDLVGMALYPGLLSGMDPVQQVERVIVRCALDRRPFSSLKECWPDTKELLLMGPNDPHLHPDTRISDLIESEEKFQWQGGESIMQTYTDYKALISYFFQDRERPLLDEMKVETAKRVKISVTERTSRQYGFMNKEFENATFFSSST